MKRHKKSDKERKPIPPRGGSHGDARKERNRTAARDDDGLDEWGSWLDGFGAILLPPGDDDLDDIAG